MDLLQRHRRRQVVARARVPAQKTAPEFASWHGTSNTVSRAMALIADGALDGEESTVDALAERLDIGERQTSHP
jgi:hypothetical protein